MIEAQFHEEGDSMTNALFTGKDNMSIHDRECEWLRRQAYKTVSMENADIPKIDKIVDGIKKGKINKTNLYDEVRKMTKRVTSDHSIKRWQIITDWFANREWLL